MAALIDTHLHLYRHEFEGDEEAVLARAHAAGVGAFLHVGYNRETIEQAQRESRRGLEHFASAGLHPHDAADWSEDLANVIVALACDDAIVAIGECGLDYFRDLSPRDAQDRAFRAQIRLARELDLPMIHHVRDAYDEARAVLEHEGLPPRRGIFHAFAGDADFARWATEQGYRLGIGGPLTYRRSTLGDFLGDLDPDALFLETDAPWLPPQPWRGKRNEPAYARHTMERMAELTGLDVDALAERQARAFEDLFRVRLPEGFWELTPSDFASPTPAGKG